MMAYCPLAQGGSLRKGLLQHPSVSKVAKETGLTPMQVLLAFVLSRDNVIAIPRTGSKEYMLLNVAALEQSFKRREPCLFGCRVSGSGEKIAVGYTIGCLY